MDEVQTVVVGAGVIGLAIARTLARLGHEVLILEAEDRIGQHTSSRNSQVIHAGIYYTPGSARADMCVRGKQMLYDYCIDRHVTFENTQKLIVAAEESHNEKIEGLIANAKANGVHDLKVLSAKEAIALEPELACYGAVLSPSTGILDVSAFMLSLLGEAESNGAFVALKSPLSKVVRSSAGFELLVGDDNATQIRCHNLINAAGLGAWNVARNIAGFPEELIPEQYFVKGSWFSAAGKTPFDHLIYPIPDDASLGVHYVRDLAGGFRFGPNFQPLESPIVDYSLDAAQAGAFEASVRRWWPSLQKDVMQPDVCGIRPLVHPKGHLKSDFQFRGPDDHGWPGLVQLFGLDSPGLTSSLAIAQKVGEMLSQAKM